MGTFDNLTEQARQQEYRYIQEQMSDKTRIVCHNSNTVSSGRYEKSDWMPRIILPPMIGALCIIVPLAILNGKSATPSPSDPFAKGGMALLFFVMGAAIAVKTIPSLFKMDEITLDLSEGNWHQKQGMLWKPTETTGPLTDIAAVRLDLAPRQVGPGTPEPWWGVQLVWKDAQRPPFPLRFLERAQNGVLTQDDITTLVREFATLLGVPFDDTTQGEPSRAELLTPPSTSATVRAEP